MTQTKVREIVSEICLQGKPVDPDQELVQSGLLDSMDVMRLVMSLEKAFDIKILPQDVVIEVFASPLTLASYVDQRLADLECT